jgi:hypothetical protein
MADTQFDLDSLDETLIQETIEINPEVNPLAAPPPFDAGVYRAKLSVVDNSFGKKYTKENKKTGMTQPFIFCRIKAEIVAPGTNVDGRVVTEYVNTLVFDGRSVMAYVLQNIWGNTPEAKERVRQIQNYVELAKLFRSTLAGEPFVRIKSDWSAQYNIGTQEEPNYKTVLTGQRNFPPLKDGGVNHLVNIKGMGEVAARSVIVDFLPDSGS